MFRKHQDAARPHCASRCTAPSGAGRAVFVLSVGLLALPALASAQTVTPPAKTATKAAKAAPSADAAAPQEAAKKRDPAAAQASVEAAANLLQSGKTDQAVASLSSAISSGSLPPAVMAKALYLRGAAYRKQTKPALAISDLTSALWLKGGLNDADRADATQQRASAYGEAGLSEQGQALQSASSARKRGDGAAAASASLAPDAGANTGASSTGLFGGLFGAKAASATPVPEAAPAAAEKPRAVKAEQAPPAAPVPAPATAAAPVKVAAATVQASPAAPKAAAVGGGYQSRVALVRTKAEADAVVAKLKVQYAGVVGDKAPTVGETSFGNMGKFFQVRVGPFASSADAQTLCGQLKGSGLDCVPVAN